MPLVHARDAAEGKVAAIGTVNPRRPGLVNSTAQFIKRMVARALDWHVREQVEFNRGAMSCVEALLTALEKQRFRAGRQSQRIDCAATAGEARRLPPGTAETRKSMHDLSRSMSGGARDSRTSATPARTGINGARDGRSGSPTTRSIFCAACPSCRPPFIIALLCSIRITRSWSKTQHTDFEKPLSAPAEDIQKRLWDDLDRIRTEYETIIHAEIRMLRQKRRATRKSQPDSAPRPRAPRLDWLKFGEKFRGAEEYVKDRQRIYADRFRGRDNVLDIGCGRGELLEVLKEAGIPARGIDLCEEAVAMCRAKALDAEVADLFVYLDGLADSSLDGIFRSQVVEHLPPERFLSKFVRRHAARCATDGLVAIETPNPECLAIFATHFYLDPTHTRPIPPPLMTFYMVEAGFGRIETERLYPAVETMPSLAELPENFRKEFFGSLDYAIFGTRLLVSLERRSDRVPRHDAPTARPRTRDLISKRLSR